jgi:hypothetical protein
MALSDQLSRLAARAKEAEDRVAAAKALAKDRLEQDVQHARESTQLGIEKLRTETGETASRAQAWGDDVQRSWREHLTQVHQRMEAHKARHQAKVAERDAQDAADYAEFTIDIAYSAIEEAEYAVLDAVLAGMDADTAEASVE